jgi:hypothetical protein
MRKTPIIRTVPLVPLQADFVGKAGVAAILESGAPEKELKMLALEEPVAVDPEGNETVWMGDKVRGRERGGGRGGGREWREGERGGRGRERERDWGRERKWRDGGNGERGGNGEIEGGRERDHGPLIIVYSWSY